MQIDMDLYLKYLADMFKSNGKLYLYTVQRKFYIP